MSSKYFTAEHDEFRSSVRRFLDEEVAPNAEAWEKQRAIPRSVFRRMGELGFLGIMYPEAYGGTDADIFFAIAFLEELPRSMMGGFCAAVSVQQFMATRHIAEHGSEELKQRYLAPSIAGRFVGALAVTEPDTGSDVAAIRTRAVRDGDDFVIRGAKTFITNGADGDFYTLAAKTDVEAGAEGITLFAIDARSAGVTVTRRLEKLGWHSSDTAELHFDDVRVPASDIIGQENMGFYYLMEAFQLERLCGAATAVGSADVCLDATLGYMKSRNAFGKPLTRFQALTHKLAELAAETEAARQLTYHAAWLLQEGHPCVKECSMAKLLATELSKRVSDECLQCFGGYGFMEEYPVSRFYRDARAGTIVAGTSEIMREIVARIMVEGIQPKRVGDRPSKQKTVPMARVQVEGPVVEPRPRESAERVDASTAEGLIRSLPVRLRADKVGDWRACFHMKLKGAAVPEWTVRIENGVCSVLDRLDGTPDCVIQAAADTYVGIESGKTNAQVAFMMGKVKVSNLAQMMKFLKAFRPLSQTDLG